MSHLWKQLKMLSSKSKLVRCELFEHFIQIMWRWRRLFYYHQTYCWWMDREKWSMIEEVWWSNMKPWWSVKPGLLWQCWPGDEEDEWHEGGEEWDREGRIMSFTISVHHHILVVCLHSSIKYLSWYYTGHEMWNVSINYDLWK